MLMSNIDFISHLKQGIFLDDDKMLIPWLTPIESLHLYDNPHIIDKQKTPSGLVTRKTPYSIFVWQDRSWCDFKCNIQTTLYTKDFLRLKKISQTNGWCYSAVVRHFYIDAIGDFSSPEQEFYVLENIFTENIGKPLHKGSRTQYAREYPFTTWLIDNIELSIVMQERFVDFNTILVKYT